MSGIDVIVYFLELIGVLFDAVFGADLYGPR